MHTSPDWLHYQAQINPDQLALVFLDERWTFRDLDADVARLAGVLATMGLPSGSRVAYRLPPGPDQVLLVHALTRMHLVLVPLNTRLTQDELTPIIENAAPALIIDDMPTAEWYSSIPHLAIKSLLDHVSPEPVWDTILDFDEVHALVYTSGTTGVPKGVELTIGNQWWSAVSFALNAGMTPHDCWLHVMPLFHVGGLTILFRSLIHGSTVVLSPRFDPTTVAHLIDDWHITLISWVPTMLHRMLELDYAPPQHLRLILLGGAPASSDLLHRARERGYRVVPTYGMTETSSQIVTLQNDLADKKTGASGHPNLPTMIRIGRSDRVEPAFTRGEILVKGPTVAKGYYRNPEATQKTFVEDWLHTGDVGYLDDEGYLHVVDRLKDLIISGGENVYPTEVESHLLAFPGILDAAVFGRPDPDWGERVAAALVFDPGHPIQRDAVEKFLSKRLASYKMPSIYFALPEIPRNASGKTLRGRLIEHTATASEWIEE